MTRGRIGQQTWLVDIYLSDGVDPHALEGVSAKEFLKRWIGPAKAFVVNKLGTHSNPPGGYWWASVKLGRYVDSTFRHSRLGEVTDEEWVAVTDEDGHEIVHRARLLDDGTVTWLTEGDADA